LPAALLAFSLFAGCAEDSYLGTYKENQIPTIRLTYGPVEGDTIKYQIHFFWLGYDDDGSIDHYELTLAEGDPFGFDPADTTGPDKWIHTTLTDSIFEVIADSFDTDIEINNRMYSRYTKTHTFFIRAVDDRGGCSEVLHRSFTAWNLAPVVRITNPEPHTYSGPMNLCPIVFFHWEVKDPIDSPWNSQEADSIRYIWGEHPSEITINDLNRSPGDYEDKWSDWIWYHEIGDSGTSTILGDDEILDVGKRYIFAIQAKDEAGAVTSIFTEKENAYYFIAHQPTGPALSIYETYFANFNVMGTATLTKNITVPINFPMNFRWEGDASAYGSSVASYRYGWDIMNLDDPTQWDVSPNPNLKSMPTKRFQVGTHTLYIEAVDFLGYATIAKIKVYIMSNTFDKNLLLVDDYYSSDFRISNFAMPTETQHDVFWSEVCSHAAFFNTNTDIYDVAGHAYVPPSVDIIWRYKNIIWVYSKSELSNIWGSMTLFWGNLPWWYYSDFKYIPNPLPTYMADGGHLWTAGDPKGSGGGLSAAPSTSVYPINIRCEIHRISSGCTDTSGTGSIPYRDYCVTVIDMVTIHIRQDEDLFRKTERDEMSYGVKDRNDPITLQYPELPDRLELWSEVTKPERFYNPLERGFNLVEAYDCEYWLEDQCRLQPQSCIHPLYRMNTRNSRSPLNECTFAFWTTKYAHIRADFPGTVAAPSVHFGVPLWYFDRAQVDSIADVIFEMWGIRNDDP